MTSRIVGLLMIWVASGCGGLVSGPDSAPTGGGEQADSGTGKGAGNGAAVGTGTGTGSIEVHVDGPTDLAIFALDFTLDNATTHMQGIARVADASAVSFEISSVPPGDNYVLQVNATGQETIPCTTMRGPATCDGSSAQIAVVAGQTSQTTASLSCGSGAVILCTPGEATCPTWTTADAKPMVVPLPGGSSMLQVSASSPNPVIDFSWSAPMGTISDEQQTPMGGSGETTVTGSALFTCPSTGGGKVPIAFVVSNPPDIDAGTCPSYLTTGSIDVVCPSPVGPAMDAGPDAPVTD
jgi:hypothetical protein